MGSRRMLRPVPALWVLRVCRVRMRGILWDSGVCTMGSPCFQLEFTSDVLLHAVAYCDRFLRVMY